MDFILSLDNCISGAAVLVGIASLIFSYNISSRALKQSEENVRKQLVYNNQIMAFKSLHKIIGGRENYKTLKIKLESFLNSFESTFLPQKTISVIHEELRKMDSYLYENDPTRMPDPDDEELEEMAYADFLAEKAQRDLITPEELFEEELKSKMYGLKTSLKNHITKKVKKDI